jgi:hypothetical protein
VGKVLGEVEGKMVGLEDGEVVGANDGLDVGAQLDEIKYVVVLPFRRSTF